MGTRYLLLLVSNIVRVWSTELQTPTRISEEYPGGCGFGFGRGGGGGLLFILYFSFGVEKTSTFIPSRGSVGVAVRSLASVRNREICCRLFPRESITTRVLIS